ncbi:MAG TPA: DNA primase [Betaproteobacteria bacterium]|nr:DNA primase [Betaproteobacteria bacterium]
MIPESFIQELLGRVDVVDVVERCVPLKKRGTNYVACCPFHTEKTPSFTVSSSKQFYHCFGCGAHGTAIGFLMAYQGLGFVDAVHELARGAGVAVPEAKDGGAPAQEHRGALFTALQHADRYYRRQLKQTPAAIEYLKRRGVTGEIAARFGIGYAPGKRRNLADVFDDYDASGILPLAGLVVEGDGGARYDRFRDRVLFPILNQQGQVVGFGGRVLGAGEPKYLNSPETPLFEKGRELYGLFQGRRAIRHANRVLVVEGYLDVIALAQHGVEYAVATLGTATTPIHVKKLLRLADTVVFCFDGDDAGRKAAWRALENSLELVADGKHLRFMFLPQGEDPDTYVRTEGKACLERLIAQAEPLSHFLVRELTRRIDLGSEEGRAHLLQAAKPLLQKITAPALGMMLRKRMGELTGLSSDEVNGLVRDRPLRREKPRPAPKGRRMPPSVARELVRRLLLQPRLADTFDMALLSGGDGDMALLAEVVEFTRAHPQVLTLAQVAQHFSGSPHAAALQAAIKDTAIWEDFGEREIAEEFTALAQQLRKKKINQERSCLLRGLQGKGLGDLTPEEREMFRRAPGAVVD